jgi:hypothetical protein
MSHVQAFNYVNRPYTRVRGDVLAHPTELFAAATSSENGAKTAELHAKAGPLEVGAHVQIEVLSITESTANNRPATKLALTWKAASRSALFPTMRATLSVYPLSATETQLELDGDYDPPLGPIGDLLDVTAMRDFAATSVQHFVDDVAAYLRG